MAKTPMMQQYEDAKAACGEALLFFRMGDFYELFHQDATLASGVLGLTLTSRDKGENAIPMAGFPHHQLDGYLSKLIRAGHRAAVCEQVEDPKLAKGLVKREVTRIVSPGTLTDDALLDPKQSNYLAAIFTSPHKQAAEIVGLAWAELSTGRFHAAVLPRDQWMDQLIRLAPSECLLAEDTPELGHPLPPTWTLTQRPPWAFSLEIARSELCKHFGTSSLAGFGFEQSDDLAISAAGAILEYLKETQRTSLDHFQRLTKHQTSDSMEIDEASWRSLEITQCNRDGSRDRSLLGVMDRTVTAMGSRCLFDWLAHPLRDYDAITRRLDAVEELGREASWRRHLREHLAGVYDLQRLLARVSTGRCSPRDLSYIARTLRRLPEVKTELAGRTSALLCSLESRLDLCADLRTQLEAALVDDCPLTTRDGGMIRRGFNSQLDQLHELATGGKKWIADYQASEAERTQISNLKVGFNRVFGYYIEITHAHQDKIPPHYVRKQTLKNAERFITEELKDYEEKVLSADEKAKDLEYSLFVQLREAVHLALHRLQTTASTLAELDVLAGLAELATLRGYCRPELVNDPIFDIRDGRHPVLDITEPEGTFVPNDLLANSDEGLIMLITGPNMAGKSTYIRQVALLTLMAQTGSFVPAQQARMGVTDRIFARVGASDELSRGQSTFMVEMTETARILNGATRHSLVILDEIGRGTSTYDGISLAWAIIEYIHDQIGCRTLFATHYHELTDLAGSLSAVTNLNVAVKEWQEEIVFLHKIVPGQADKSYGIHVARLAGVPPAVNDRAKEVLTQLENGYLDKQGQPRIARPRKQTSHDLQLSLFDAAEHPLLESIRKTDLNLLTPLDALQQIKQWQEELQTKPQLKPR